MITPPPAVNVPLRTDQDGAIRIGETRVLLEMVVRAFERGATPEGIVQSFPSLKLGDVYAVIAWYMQNRAEVDAYMRRVEADSERIRREIEAAQPDMTELRTQLLRRLAERKQQSS